MKRRHMVGLVVVGLVVIGVAISLLILPKLDIFDHSVLIDDSAPDLIKLSNPYYELGLSKSNGAITYLTDKGTGQPVTDGDMSGNLWVVTFTDSIQSSTYSPTGPNRFSYSWLPSSRQLMLVYTPDPANQNHINVTVRINASKSKGFTLQMEMQNHWGYAPSEIKFPADLTFHKADIKEVLLPILPGVVLESGFFARGISFETSYPGYPGVFADFMAVSSARGSFAIYSKAVDGQDHIVPAFFGVNLTQCTDQQATCLTHNYRARPLNKTTWMSPLVHIRVSETRQDTIQQFREDDGLSTYQSSQTKLGLLYDKFVQMPLYKADAVQLGLKFSDYASLLAKVPFPGLLHSVGYMPGGHDHSYPDFLPPDPQWGSTGDMAAMFMQAQSMGFLVMPYINPTWWDGSSPTLLHLPKDTTITNISAINANTMQLEECYGCPANPRYGYAVSPYVDFIQNRLSQVMAQMKKDVPSDLIFEDQIGARVTLFDFNPSEPSIDAYTQGWIEHTRKYAGSKLMTEDGFDRLVETEIGFNGGTLLSDRNGETDIWWGNHNWHYYPFVTLAARDKVFFYQHDLAPESFTQNEPILLWNVAMGYMLSYDLNPSDRLGGGVKDPFIKIVASFQKYVLSQYASELMASYTNLGPKLTRSAFESVEVTANWDGKNEAEQGNFTLAPSGFLIQKKDGSLNAGLLTRYNGKALSDGDHYLIEERQAKEIIVRQPVGSDTSISLMVLPGWSASTALTAQPYSADDCAIGAAQAATVSGNLVTFNYQPALSGQPVAYYVIKVKN